MSQNIYSALTKFVFLVFTIMLPIMLLNMLIAMMGNTYSTVISMSEKEWVKAWAKIVIALERAVPQAKAKEFLYVYSVPLGGGGDEGGEENLGVMVIKCKDKTKAKQRKGALSNWKRVGKVTIKELKRRRVTGEVLRREMWGLCSAQSTPLHGVKKKGGANAYNVKAGITTSLEDVLYGEDEDSDFDAEANDGFGALTGAIDQLAFTNDLDFSGDGIDYDDDSPVKSMRPEQFTAQNIRMKQSQEHGGAGKKKKVGLDNQAFLGDEDILIAAAVAAADDEDSDDPDRVKKAKKQKNKSGTPNETANHLIPPAAFVANPSSPCPPGAYQGVNAYPGQYPGNSGYPGSYAQHQGHPGLGSNYTASNMNGLPPGQSMTPQNSCPPGSQMRQGGLQLNQSNSAVPSSQMGQAGIYNGGAGNATISGQSGPMYHGNGPHYSTPGQFYQQPSYGPNQCAQNNAYVNSGMPNGVNPQPGNMQGPTSMNGPPSNAVGQQGPPNKLPPICQNKRSRPVSARVKRLGSAQKSKPNLDKTFKHLEPIPMGAKLTGPGRDGTSGLRPGMPGIPSQSQENASDKEISKSTTPSREEADTRMTPKNTPAIADSKKSFEDSTSPNHEEKNEPSSYSSESTKTSAPAKSIEKIVQHIDKSSSFPTRSTSFMNGSVKIHSTSVDLPNEYSKSAEVGSNDDQWADKKNKKLRKNKVSPSVEGMKEDHKTQDEEVDAVDEKEETPENVTEERLNTNAPAKQAEKFESESVENMNEILPWNSEEGDIKEDDIKEDE
ncbi:hypothetical protein FHG87_011101 [Trinorchestia longiramus]|nr:hypothetical protein FHG87_011101 [Trinorchestia longiramus]